MDPTHVLSGQVFQHHGTGKTSPEEIQAFYERHGLAVFAALPRWRARLSAWRRIRNRQERPIDFAPEVQKG